MIRQLLIYTILFLAAITDVFSQTGLIQTAHLPSNSAAYSPELIIATADSGAWLIGNRYPGLVNSHRHQRTFTKVDKFGAAQMQKYFTFQNFSNTNSHTEIFAACKTLNEGLVICGQTDNQFFAIKLTSSCDTVWCKTEYSNAFFNGLRPQTILATKDSGFVIAGDHKLFDIALLKLDKNGNKIWSQIETEITEVGSKLTCLAEGPDSSIYAGGQQRADQSTSNPLLLKLNKSGAPVWKKVFLSNQTPNSLYSSFLGLHFTGNKLYASAFTGVNLFGVVTTNGEVSWLKKLNLSLNGYGFNRSTNALFDLDNNNIYANIGGALYTFDSTAQCKFVLNASGYNQVNFAALAGGKIMGIGIANLWSTDIVLPTRAYTLSINDAYTPQMNRCYQVSQISLSNYAMRDSIMNSTPIDSIRIQSMALVGSGVFSIQTQSGCDLTAGLENNHITTTDLVVQPNPSDGRFLITAQNAEITRISVLSADARLLSRQDWLSTSESFQIDLSEQAPGIYFFIAETKTGEKFRVRLIRCN